MLPAGFPAVRNLRTICEEIRFGVASMRGFLLDPNGAAFGIIPVVAAEGVPPANGNAATPVGRNCWLELTVSDAAATRDFDRRVIGWSVHNIEREDGSQSYADFQMLDGNAKPVAGICHARGVNRDLPPVWLLYLPVGDMDESLRRGQEEGEKIVKLARRKNGRICTGPSRTRSGSIWRSGRRERCGSPLRGVQSSRLTHRHRVEYANPTPRTRQTNGP
jgi:predicted enzyme related to lactoylglutathione lyase